MTLLIDRSNNNGTDNYPAAKKAGVTHAYFKATDGLEFVDATYHERFAAADDAGIIVGAYHYGEHGAPVAEADHFLSIIHAPRAGRLRPCLDLESGQSAEWAAAFVEHLHANLGYWPVIYGNTSTIPALRAANASVRACPWWRAEYGPNDGSRHALTGGSQGAVAHQYTSNAHVAGLSGATDASVFLLNPAVMTVPTPKRKFLGVQSHWTGKDGKAKSGTFRGDGWFKVRHPKAILHGEVRHVPRFK